MKTSIFVGCIALCTMSPITSADRQGDAQSPSFRLDVAHAQVSTRPFTFQPTPDGSVESDAGSFDMDVVAVSVGVSMLVGGVPGFADIVWSNNGRGTRQHRPAPVGDPSLGLPPGARVVNHAVGIRGARIGVNPKFYVRGAWEGDWLIGVHYLRRNIDNGPFIRDERQGEFGPFVGAGVTYLLGANSGVRVGVDFARRYRSIGVGWRYAFD